MITQEEIDHAPFDGWRVYVDDDNSDEGFTAVRATLTIRGIQVTDILVAEFSDAVRADYIQCFIKFATAAFRFFWETGDESAIEDIADTLSHSSRVDYLPLLSAASKEEHERVYELEDGNLLFVVEGESAEVVTPHELRDMLIERQADDD